MRDGPSGSGSGRTEPRPVSLALQGGGAHGAFTWGVLDRLLEDGRLSFEGISGTSAGAVNGAVLAYGLVTGGREKARELLDALWRRIACGAIWSPIQPSWIDRLTGNPNLDGSPAYLAFDFLSRLLSPYQLNPTGWNPMRDLLGGLMDMEVLRSAQEVRLYVSATNVRSGRLKVFAGPELSVDALLASACLPHLFQAVEIGGEHYWDGGFMGNPTIYPLIHACASPDVLVVQINPISRPDLPRTATEIMDRVNEVSFNATFMREIRALGLVNRLIAEKRLEPGECGLRPIFLHLIGNEEAMRDFTMPSKLNADWGFLRHLFDIGREAAGLWLDAHCAQVGREGTFMVDSLLA
jgi:NTE family protein